MALTSGCTAVGPHSLRGRLVLDAGAGLGSATLPADVVLLAAPSGHGGAQKAVQQR